MIEVYLRISWSDLFDTTMTSEIRKERWEQWKSLCEDKDDSIYYEDGEGCEKCDYFNNGWCEIQGLPSGFNPLTRSIGMACLGIGNTSSYREYDGQLILQMY